jgi:hypothetical protein
MHRCCRCHRLFLLAFVVSQMSAEGGLFVRLIAAEQATDFVHQIAYGLERFGQDIVRADSARLRFVERFKRADEQHDGDVPRALVPLNVLAQLIAVRLRHEDIGEDDVRQILVQFLDGLRTTADRDDLHRLIGEG